MIIVITGASSGIGKGFKEYYEAKGHKVYNISREEADFNCDVTDFNAIKNAFAEIGKNGKIDMLISCAGFGGSGAVELTEHEKVQAIYDVNIIGTINCIQACIPLMENSGKIINISSAMALFPIPFRGFYASSKSAIITLTDALRMELSSTKIQVTALCPSDIKTNFTKNRLKDYKTNERYGEAIKLSTEKIDSREERRMPLDKAIKIMTKWINKKHLKPLYVMTFKFKLLKFAMGIFPKSLYLKICTKAYYKQK